MSDTSPQPKKVGRTDRSDNGQGSVSKRLSTPAADWRIPTREAQSPRTATRRSPKKVNPAHSDIVPTSGSPYAGSMVLGAEGKRIKDDLLALPKQEALEIVSAAARELGLHSVTPASSSASANTRQAHVEAQAEISLPRAEEAVPKLSAKELEAFKAHARAHQWKPRSGISPSAFIKENFSEWLGRGLTRSQVANEQLKSWADSYAAELHRHPESRIKGLIERPRNLPAGTPAPISTKPTKRSGSQRLVSELTPEQLAARRERKKNWARQHRLRGPKPSP